MKEEREVWTPEWLLQAWGLRAFGALTTPWKLSTGGRPSSDDESQATWYVEHTQGFDRAKEVLVWKYQRGRELTDFPIRQPGETLVRALLRRNWGAFMGRPGSHVAELVYEEFLSELGERIKSEPFHPIRVEGDDDQEEGPVYAATWQRRVG